MSKAHLAVGLALLSVLCLLGLIVVVALTSTHYDGLFGLGSGWGLASFSVVSLLAGAVIAVCLLTIMLWMGWADALNGEWVSLLYYGITTTAIGAVIVLSLTGAAAFGLLRNDLRQPWAWPSEPEVQLLRAVGFDIFIAGLAFKVVTFLRGRGASWRAVASLFALIVVAVVSILAVALTG